MPVILIDYKTHFWCNNVTEVTPRCGIRVTRLLTNLLPEPTRSVPWIFFIGLLAACFIRMNWEKTFHSFVFYLYMSKTSLKSISVLTVLFSKPKQSSDCCTAAVFKEIIDLLVPTNLSPKYHPNRLLNCESTELVWRLRAHVAARLHGDW